MSIGSGMRLPVLGAPAATWASKDNPVYVPAVDQAEADRLMRQVAHRAGEAIRDFNLIEQGDRILVAVSGGKDSYTLLRVLERLRRRAPIRFELLAVNVDQSYEGYRPDVIEAWLRKEGFRYRMVKADIAGLVEEHLEEGERYCSLCARLRRGVLYRVAVEEGATKIALGHHADDLVETLLLNQFFAGETKTMPPRLRSDDRRNVVIRPLVYVPEDLILSFARASGFPIVCCMCPACGDETMKRKQVKAWLATLEAAHPGVKKSLLTATTRVNLAHMLDRRWTVGGQGQ